MSKKWKWNKKSGWKNEADHTSKAVMPLSNTSTYGKGEIRTKALPSIDDVQIILPDDVYQKILHWCRKVNTEVSGLGSCVWSKERDAFVVTDAMMIEQTSDDVSAGSAYLSGEAMLKASKEYENVEGFGRFHWHSHAGMKTFWSGDDEDLIRTIGKHGWKVAMVFNHSGNYKAAFYQKIIQPWDKVYEVFVDDAKCTITKDVPDNVKAQWDKMFTDKFTVIERPAISNYYHDYSDYYGGYDNHMSGYNSHESYKNHRRGMEWQGDMLAPSKPVWKPPKNISNTGLEYDQYGMCHINGELYYNPLRDSSVYQLQERIREVAIMDDEEFKTLSVLDEGLMQFALTHLEEIEAIKEIEQGGNK